MKRTRIGELTINLGDRTAPVTTRINSRARRLIVRVDPSSGRVIVTAPSARALPEALKFAHKRSAWILERLNEAIAPTPFVNGAVIPFRGERHLIEHDPSLRRTPIACADGRIVAGGDEAHLNRRIQEWLRREARRTLIERADYYAGLLGKRRGPITIRDTRSRWGSCTADGALSFSWRLILAPPAILDYVAAHECAHLVHLDHSRAYWRVVRGLGVDARAARDWFITHGPSLYSYGEPARPGAPTR